MDIKDFALGIACTKAFAKCDAQLFQTFDQIKAALPKACGANPLCDILARYELMKSLESACKEIADIYGKLLLEAYPEMVVEEKK